MKLFSLNLLSSSFLCSILVFSSLLVLPTINLIYVTIINSLRCHSKMQTFPSKAKAKVKVLEERSMKNKASEDQAQPTVWSVTVSEHELWHVSHRGRGASTSVWEKRYCDTQKVKFSCPYPVLLLFVWVYISWFKASCPDLGFCLSLYFFWPPLPIWWRHEVSVHSLRVKETIEFWAPGGES